ncbi:hypothetical protein CDAR_506821 [Caerostris darwini]|uniref:LAGLIDADG homing endonuclease n=1 Tax=Caerostris darwini TaxID=1538125 RepID=A0AAV4P2Q2_9ARAC|nr:hypothetical protein CDAR_506821 [Caerostris darwini]
MWGMCNPVDTQKRYVENGYVLGGVRYQKSLVNVEVETRTRIEEYICYFTMCKIAKRMGKRFSARSVFDSLDVKTERSFFRFVLSQNQRQS